MHEPVKGHLEDYLRGDAVPPAVEQHLRACEPCRREVSLMKLQATLLQSLRPVREIEPPAGFYAAVLQRIESQDRPSVWNLFGESLFARRLAFASGSFLLLFGAFLFSWEAETAENPDPVAMYLAAEEPAQPRVTLGDPERDRNVVLVDLVSHSQDAWASTGGRADYYQADYQ